MIKVRILKPVSRGRGRRGGVTFFKIGQIIDFEKDVGFNLEIDIAKIKKQAEELEKAGYVEFVHDEPRPVTANKVELKPGPKPKTQSK